MKQEILKLLKETDSFLSGQSICESLSVSRTAVWKVINQLKEEGYEIQSVRNKGYRLGAFADVMTEAELASCIRSKWCGREIRYFSETDSTNIQAKRLAELGAAHGCLVVADSQTAGRGRLGRNWTSDPGTGIWMSLILRPSISPVCASMLTLVAALAVSAGISRSTGQEIQIKWPNDLVCRRKKLCGILTEMSTELDYIHYVVTGIGINVNNREFPDEIKETAGSLYAKTGVRVQRSSLICSIMSAYERYYQMFVAAEDLSGLAEEYNRKLVNLGRTVRVLEPGREYAGTALGIDCQGQLLVETPEREVRQVISGEVSVRGIYGYV